MLSRRGLIMEPWKTPCHWCHCHTLVCSYRWTDTVTNWSYLVNIEILSKKGALLCGRLLAVVGQDLSEGCYGILRLSKCEGLTTDCEVDVVLCQRPAPLLVHLHGLAVTAQRVPPLQWQLGGWRRGFWGTYVEQIRRKSARGVSGARKVSLRLICQAVVERRLTWAELLDKQKLSWILCEEA